MTKHGPAIILLAAVLVAPVGAGVGPAATFHARHVELDLQNGGASGALAAFRTRDLGVDSIAAVEPPAELPNAFLLLHAERLDVQTDSADYYADSPIVKGPVPGPTAATPSPTVHTTFATYHDATLTGTGAREQGFVYGFPFGDEPLIASISCGNAVPPAATTTVHAPGRITPGAAMDADVSKSVELTPCGEDQLQICGDFRIALWERDGAISSAEGNLTFWSGKKALDAQADTRPFASKAQEVLATVTNGCLTLPGDPSVAPSLFLNTLDVTNATAMQLGNATGALASGAALKGDAIALSGNLKGSIVRSDDGLTVSIDSGLTGLAVDGRPVPLATVQAAPGSAVSPWLWLSLGGIGAVGLVATRQVLVVARRLRLDHAVEVDAAVERCEELFEAGDYDGTHAAALAAMSRAPDDVRARLALVRALDALGRSAEAEDERAYVAHLYGAAGNDRGVAVVALLGLRSALARNSLPDAIRWMGRAREAEPRSRDEMILDRGMAKFVAQVEYPAKTPEWLRP